MRRALGITILCACVICAESARAEGESGRDTPGAVADADTNADSDTGVQADTGVGSGTGSESDTGAGAGTGTGTGTEATGASSTNARTGSVDPVESDGVRWISGSARYDAVIGWASRYQLATNTDPLGLEQALWRRVDVLPFYHRLSVNGALRLDEGITLSLHFSGWGTVNLLADEGGGVAAGDVVLGYLELDIAPRSFAAPVSLWVGRRFIAHGPPGGVQLDGAGARVRSAIGLFAEAFVGRPVTPTRTSLLGPEPAFDGASVAYGARVGYDDPGVFVASAGYAELWGHGLLGSRTLDVNAVWDPGPLTAEGSLKLDVTSPAVILARVSVLAPIVRELSLDAEAQHLEPGRWIPPWSILSAFEASTFDEVALGATVRLAPGLAARAQGAARLYAGEVPGELRAGYRADLVVRLVPARMGPGPTFRVLGSRRDDGVLGYTLVTAGVSASLLRELLVAVDGALAFDDGGERVSVSGRASLDASPGAEWTIGLWASVARTPITDADVRAMLRARWEPVL